MMNGDELKEKADEYRRLRENWPSKSKSVLDTALKSFLRACPGGTREEFEAWSANVCKTYRTVVGSFLRWVGVPYLSPKQKKYDILGTARTFRGWFTSRDVAKRCGCTPNAARLVLIANCRSVRKKTGRGATRCYTFDDSAEEPEDAQDYDGLLGPGEPFQPSEITIQLQLLGEAKERYEGIVAMRDKGYYLTYYGRRAAPSRAALRNVRNLPPLPKGYQWSRDARGRLRN